MKPKAVGFYWTLPVPWAGFTSLSSDIDEAAMQSWTIRYQREIVRTWARDNGFELIHEGVFLELAPDRGDRLIVPALEALADLCRREGATLLFVDFSEEQRWRSHAIMEPWLETCGVQAVPVWPQPVQIDGREHDPAQHFQEWRQRDKAWRAAKPQREAAALARTSDLKARGWKLPAIAAALNAEGVISPTGKPWTADNLRKFLAKARPSRAH